PPPAVHQARRRGAQDPQAAGRLLLPRPAGAAPSYRPGPVGRGHGGLCAWHLDPQGRRPGQGPGRGGRSVQVRGLPDLRRAGRRGGGVPVPLAWPHRLPVCVPGRHLPQGPGGWTGGLPGGSHRHRGDRRRRPGSPGPRRGRQRGRRVLDRLPALAQGPRAVVGVQLVISAAHTGLRAAITAVMAGACWQRCRVHFLRNVLARVPRGSAEMVAAAIRTIFAQPTGAEVVDQVDKVAAMLQPMFPALAAMLPDAREDLTAFASFPTSHWVKIWSTNPLERVNKEVKRRTNVVGIFPDDAAVLRLAGAVLIESHDEWQ